MICRRGTESMTACSDPRAGRKRERKGESFSPSGLRGDSGGRSSRGLGERLYENLQELQRRQKRGEEGVVARGFRMAQRLRGSREGTDTPRRLPGCIGRGRPSEESRRSHPSTARGEGPFRHPASGRTFAAICAPESLKARVPAPAFKRISKSESAGRLSSPFLQPLQAGDGRRKVGERAEKGQASWSLSLELTRKAVRQP